MLIVVEGLEFSGKTTLVAGLVEYFKSQYPDREIVSTRAPGSTRLGRSLRGLLLDRDTNIDPHVELLLFAADLFQQQVEVVTPALDRNAIVITDRYAVSTIAYQGYGRELDLKWIERILIPKTWHQKTTTPVLYFYLKLEVGTMLDRMKDRDALDRIEREDVDFWRRVKLGFDVQLQPGRCTKVVDASLPAEEVLSHAIGELQIFLSSSKADFNA